MKNYDNWQKLVCAMLFAIFLVSVVFNIFSGNKIVYMDERDYVALSDNIATQHQYIGDDLKSTAYRPPIYPLVLSTFSWLNGNKIVVLKILNSIFLVFTALLYGLISAEVDNRRTQVICIALIGLYPIFYFTSSLLYPQIFGAMLFALISWIILKHGVKTSELVVAGILYGLLILTVPLFILTLPIIALFMLLDADSGKFVSKLIRPLVFCLIAAVVVLCWTARNYYVFNKFIPIATNSGFNLFVGNSENAGFNTGTAIDLKEHELEIEKQNLNEYEKDLYYRNQAIEWIKTNPGGAIKLYFGKVLNYFNYTNKLFVEEQGSKVKDIIMFISYMPLLLIAIVRLFFIVRVPLSRTEKYLYLIYFGMAFMSAIFFTRLRFRVPFDFCLIAIVSIACSKFLSRSRLDQLRIKNWGIPPAAPAFTLRPSCSTKLSSLRGAEGTEKELATD